ncbi:MAG TPA: cytochrome c oxidase assembly protein [Acidimicrobiales bacterium]|nr:cytochrome c oxidase assembly protein [Acidimicrobiales bacterium]
MIFADAISPVVNTHALLTTWQTDWLSLVSLGIETAFAVGYVVFVRRLAARGRPWSPWRTISFVAGILTIVIAVQSGVASYDDSVFDIHVIQHLLLMNVAPILLALGAPVTLVLQAGRRTTQQRVLKVLHHPIIEAITNPVVVLVVFSATMVGYFLTPFYQFSLEHPLLHDLTHLHFLIAGCLYWWLVVGIDPSRWRLSYPMKLGFLAVGIPVGTVLGLGLTQSRVSVAPLFHSLADTRAGGATLWIMGEIFTFVAMGIVVLQWMRADVREAARADRRADAVTARAVAGLEPAAAGGQTSVRPRAEPPLAGRQLTDDSIRRGVTPVRFDGGRLVVDDRVDAPPGD